MYNNIIVVVGYWSVIASNDTYNNNNSNKHVALPIAPHLVTKTNQGAEHVQVD